MSEDRRKTNKHSTGTVPKTKYRNNTSYSLNDRDGSQNVTNNLASTWHHSDFTNFIRNPRRNNYLPMDDQSTEPIQNGLGNFKANSNGTATPNSNSSNSRRNSGGLKCDNVSKYPDKKQIEDKLCQIREYLRITNSMMMSMKNTEEQSMNEPNETENLLKMQSDLQDSEVKLIEMLELLNEGEGNDEQALETGGSEANTSYSQKNESDESTLDLESLRDQQRALMRLQQKAENKLKDARQVQEKMFQASMSNDVNQSSNRKEKNLSDIDSAIQALEERTKRLNEPRGSNIQDKILAEVDSLHNQILTMHNANDERVQLIEVLDNRDAELRSHQLELQTKLMELQTKKSQVDQLVEQLQAIDDAEQENDVGGQVKKIVTMKDQLKKLKDMLEIVQTTENMMQNPGFQDVQATACDACTTAENFLQKDFQKTKLQQQNDVLRYDNNTNKQVNKNIRESKHRTSSISEKLALQAELEAKKRELEEIMGKHKAGTSNLNHDVGIDNKSEFSCTSNALNDTLSSGWLPSNRAGSSSRFSSDDGHEDINEYSDNQNSLLLPSMNFIPKHNESRIRDRLEYAMTAPSHSDRLAHSVSRTPERNARSSSVARERPRSNNCEQNTSKQVQKQLLLIKSVCESMLEQPPANNQQANVQQFRNNLTPSPLYSEPAHSMNAVNVVNGTPEMPWFLNNHSNSNMQAEMAGYQSWLATNTLQTQSFMLNTLNQCCQMLWLQQRELAALRSSVSLIQDRVDVPPINNLYENQGLLQQNQMEPPRPPNPHYNPQAPLNLSPNPNPKTNHVSAACSMPNLNHCNVPPQSNLNLEQSAYGNNVRLLDQQYSNLNNINHAAAAAAATNMHGVNANINSTQMWNGQALNNQVAPGNRANNYWDNFRSYSRQNLLSSKNNEVLQNLPPTLPNAIERDRTNPFTLMSFSKSNSEQDSTSTSYENTPQRRMPLPKHVANTSSAQMQPDVLNINHNVMKFSEATVAPPHPQDDSIGYQVLLNTYNDTGSNYSNASEDCPLALAQQGKKRNGWHNEVASEDSAPKSKLIDELQENVYKEVASLISANEARPHFLIQLFRDLQMIGSDSVRLKILQSIQTVITHSLLTSQATSSSPIEDAAAPSSSTDCFSMQSTVWSKQQKNVATSRNLVNLSNENVQNPLKDIVPFLNDHETEFFHHHLLEMLKQILLESDSFKESVPDTVFQKHFSNVLDDVLELFIGKKVVDVKMQLIQTINDLFRGEFSFIQLIQETAPDSVPVLNSMDFNECVFEMRQPVEMQNGDLAEADQSRTLEQVEGDEEGAVGGLLEIVPEATIRIEPTSDEVDLPTIEFPNSTEGLDQVPTRLPTKIKSRSTTPSKDSTSEPPY